MVKWLFVLVFILEGIGKGSELKKPLQSKHSSRDLLGWYDQFLSFKALNPQLSGNFPMHIVVVEEFFDDRPPLLLEFDGKSFDLPGLLRWGKTEDLQSYYQLNALPQEIKKKDKLQSKNKSKKEWLIELLGATSSDTIIDGSGSVWTAYRWHRNSLVIAHSSPRPFSNAPEHIKAWMTKSLGYNAVVLEQKGDYLLVGAYDSFVARDIQGLIVYRSHDHFKVVKNPVGGGIIQGIQASGFVGLFKVILRGPIGKKIARGTKIILQTKGGRNEAPLPDKNGNTYR